MNSQTSELQIKVPATLDDALVLLASKPQFWKPFAGGTDIMVELHAGKLSHFHFLSLHEIAELRGIEESEHWLTLGATTTYRDILSHDTIAREFPNLREAARWTGATAIQNRGTIGGNIGNASPAADTPPTLISYDAEIELASTRGRRWIPYSNFHTGYKTTLAEPDEIITRIRLPRTQEKRLHFYRKVGPRKALAITKLSLAAVARVEYGTVLFVRMGWASLGPTVLQPASIEKEILGVQLSANVIHDICSRFKASLKPISDVRSTAEYRSQVAANVLREFLESLMRG